MAKSTSAKVTAKKNVKPAPKTKAAPAPKAVEAPKPKASPAPAPAAVTATKSNPASSVAQKTISAQDRYHMIDEAAYYRAEKNGFQVDPHANWIAAEKEIDELLAKQNIKVG